MVAPRSDALFTGIDIGPVTSVNRIAMAPMVTNFAEHDGSVTSNLVEYYRVRARGGAGLIIVEASDITPSSKITYPQVGIYEDRHIPGLEQISAAIKAEGALAFVQLCHGGPKAFPQLNDRRPVSASAIEVRPGVVPVELSDEELGDLIARFGDAAERAIEAGFDGIELHAAHLYLLSSFLSPFTNRREDRWGGSTENRARLVCSVIQEVKSRTGRRVPLICRFNGAEGMPGGLSVDEGCSLAIMFEQAGADALHVSAYTAVISDSVRSIRSMAVGWGAVPLVDTQPGAFLPLANRVKQSVQVPVLAVGKLSDPVLAIDAVTSKQCDMVALGRQMFIDPYWPQKVKEGNFDAIRLCTYCGICHTMQQKFRPVMCAENRNLTGEPLYTDIG